MNVVFHEPILIRVLEGVGIRLLGDAGAAFGHTALLREVAVGEEELMLDELLRVMHEDPRLWNLGGALTKRGSVQ